MKLARKFKLTMVPLIAVPLLSVAGFWGYSTWYGLKMAGQGWPTNGSVMCQTLIDQVGQTEIEKAKRFIENPSTTEPLVQGEHLFFLRPDNAISRVTSQEFNQAGNPELLSKIRKATQKPSYFAFDRRLFIAARVDGPSASAVILKQIDNDLAKYLATSSSTEISFFVESQNTASSWRTTEGKTYAPPPLSVEEEKGVSRLMDLGRLYNPNYLVGIDHYVGFFAAGNPTFHIGDSLIPSFMVAKPLFDSSGVYLGYSINYVPREPLVSGPRIAFIAALILSSILLFLILMLMNRFANRISQPISEVSSKIIDLAERISKSIPGAELNLSLLKIEKESELSRLNRSYEYLENIFIASEEIRERINRTQQQIANTAKLAMLGEMAGGIAHEINNPLAVIHMRAKHIKRAAQNMADAKDILEFASIIEITSSKISKIIEGLRSFARMGDHDPFHLVKVQDIINDSVGLCSARCEQFGITLKFEPIPEDITIECRSVQISQILVNLLSNAYYAIKDQPHDRRWVKVECEDCGDRIQISVIDSGGGIPEGLKSKLMQPFFTTKPLGEGTGLGLSISFGIAIAHNGRLFLSEESKHTTFIIDLPKKQGLKSEIKKLT